MTELTAAQRLDLMKVIDDRHDRATTMLTTQAPVTNWGSVAKFAGRRGVSPRHRQAATPNRLATTAAWVSMALAGAVQNQEKRLNGLSRTGCWALNDSDPAPDGQYFVRSTYHDASSREKGATAIVE